MSDVYFVNGIVVMLEIDFVFIVVICGWEIFEINGLDKFVFEDYWMLLIEVFGYFDNLMFIWEGCLLVVFYFNLVCLSLYWYWNFGILFVLSLIVEIDLVCV